MKRNRFAPAFRNLVLMLVLAACSCLTACCDGTIDVTGKVLDAASGAPLDSVRVTIFYSEKKQANAGEFSITDSLGRFFLWDSGYCGKELFFILATKPGYVSQTLDVEKYSTDLVVNLVRD